ncbi:uncharacterized protein LOC112466341 isoform X1 [Temnothorax curvispinosus]|uniref:Odorant receptor n=2 Tax=Temnothorax curvispinosus TaxID=300111 RepID=A0A6J1R693_9HYME|nr:uncharacterized protein LOC112466341 isoform X1 [Temnothorax curvispinosus]
MHVYARGEMICINSLHIGLNRFLLLTFGLWPYQQSKLVQFQLVLFLSILATFILFQLTTFLTSQCTPDLLINVLSSALFFITFVIKYILFSINFEVIKCLLEQLQHIRNELTDKNEINIMKEYASDAKRYTAIFTLCVILLAFALLLYPIWPRIFDILLPMNETRPHISPLFVTEYFVDQEKYFYLIILHANTAFTIGVGVMLATGTMFIVYIQYACGMFRIASYRVKQAITIEILQKNSLKNENLIYKGLVYAVDMHRKAIKFSESTISRFKVMFFLLIVVGVICASLNFFRIFQVASLSCDVKELSLRLIFVIIHFCYMFVGNYLAQEITNHNNDVFATVYNVQWYVTPLQIQKMILFLLQRGTKAFTMNIAGLFVGSLEGAATLLSTAVSYFTILHSTQN